MYWPFKRKSLALPELVRRAAMTEKIDRFRYAVVALHLGDPQPARDSLALRDDPIDRTTWIHGFAAWHGDLAYVGELLAKDGDAAFRSGVCAALGTIAVNNIPAGEQDAVIRALSHLYIKAPDGGTHSAAGCGYGNGSKFCLKSPARRNRQRITTGTSTRRG